MRAWRQKGGFDEIPTTDSESGMSVEELGIPSRGQNTYPPNELQAIFPQDWKNHPNRYNRSLNRSVGKEIPLATPFGGADPNSHGLRFAGSRKGPG